MMAGLDDEELLSTPIDKLIELVKEEQSVPLEYAASKIGEDVKTVEEWASVLEEQGIITIDYKLSKVILRWNAPTKQEFEKRKADYLLKKREVQEAIKSFGKEVERESEELKRILLSLSKFKSDYGEKLNTFKEILEELKKREELSDKKYRELSDKVESLLARSESITDRISLLQMNLNRVAEELKSYDIDEKYQRILKEKENVKKMIEAMERTKSELESIRTNILSILGEMGDVKEVIKEVNTAYEFIKNFDERLKQLEEQLKSVKELRSLFKNIDVKIKSYFMQIDEIKEKLSNLSGNFDEIKEKLKELEEERNDLKEEIETLEISLNEIKSNASALLEGIPKPEEIKTLKSQLEKLKEKVGDVEEINASLEKLKEVDRIVADIAKLQENVEREKDRLAKEAGDIISLVEEEIDTFNTFQQIKDKVLKSVDEYIAELDSLMQDYETLKSDAVKLQGEIDEALVKIKTAGEEGELEPMLKALKKLSKEYSRLEEAEKRIKELKHQLDAIGKNIALLQKELKIMELRNPEEVSSKLEMTREEMEDYKRKKAELTEYLKKLWSSED